jgi:hypothetical protein
VLRIHFLLISEKDVDMCRQGRVRKTMQEALKMSQQFEGGKNNIGKVALWEFNLKEEIKIILIKNNANS